MKEEYLRYFPKETCYPNQKEAMKSIFASIMRKQIVLFEGACGTGKTLSALVPALYISKKQDKAVVIATNVHQQMLQFIEEAREIKRTNEIKVLVLKGKILMCPYPDMDYETCSALRENTYELLEVARETSDLKTAIKSVVDKFRRTKDASLGELLNQLNKELAANEKKVEELKTRTCSNLYEVLTSDSEEFRTWLFAGVRTPEEVAEWAYEKGMCGYELLKREMKFADLLICNYHHLLNKEILENILAWMDRSLDEIIAIFDEAHNIEAAARSHSSIALTEHTVERALDEVQINQESDKDIETLLGLFLDALRTTIDQRFKFGERERVGSNWYDLRISDPEERRDVLRARFLRSLADKGIDAYKVLEKAQNLGLRLDEAYKERFKKGKSRIRRTSPLLTTSIFLESYLRLANDPHHYPILNVRRQEKRIYGRVELFPCIPKNVTEPLFNSLYSGVLMSATLRPFETVKTTLGITRDTCEIAYELSFPRERRHTIAVAVPPLFAKDRDSPQTTEIITKVLRDIVEQSSGNVLVFFPSYYEASQYHERLKLEVPVFLDEVGVSAQDIREKFFNIGEKGGKAVLISYMWGTLTEGVDYKDGRGRTVVIVGVGYPALNDRMRAIEAAYDIEYGRGWDYAIEIPTIRKVRQAMGRVVRSPLDYGARVLLDSRYLSSSTRRLGKYSVYNHFPPEEREEIIDVEPGRVKYSLLNFFESIRRSEAKE